MTPHNPRTSAGRLASSAYTSIGLETQVLSASPERLITLLFDGARAAVARARLHMRQNNIEGRGMAISKAIDIVDSGLKASVDAEAGGELATNLIATYQLVIRTLMQANLYNDPEKLAVAERILTDIGDAWRQAVDPAESVNVTPSLSPVRGCPVPASES